MRSLYIIAHPESVGAAVDFEHPIGCSCTPTITLHITAGLSAASVRAFDALHRQHIMTEEEQLMPLVTLLLAPADLSRIGRAMAKRRGIVLP